MTTKNKKDIGSMLLPYSNDEMETFISKNKVMIYDHVLRMIEHAIDNGHPLTELYRFGNSGYVVVLHDTQFIANLDFIINQLVKLENYELCAYAKLVKNKVEARLQTFRTNYVKK